jgi:hypothetical protein
MKKVALLFLSSVLLLSCGDKKKETTPTIEEVKDKYVVIIDAIYEKDDSIAVVYKKDNYFKYDTPVSLKIKGAPTMQRLTIEIPEGEAVENLSIVASTNKNQEYVTIKNISVTNGNDKVDGDNYKHIKYFLVDNSFSWDLKNSRYNLVHTNKYPPGIVGNEILESLLMK